jgi:hypothetical protein
MPDDKFVSTYLETSTKPCQASQHSAKQAAKPHETQNPYYKTRLEQVNFWLNSFTISA